MQLLYIYIYIYIYKEERSSPKQMHILLVKENLFFSDDQEQNHVEFLHTEILSS